MNYQEYHGPFQDDGFVVVRQFLPPDEFADLNANLERYIREIVPTLSDGDAFFQEPGRPETLKQLQHMGECDPYFSRYREQPRWIALAEALLGERATAKQPEWFNKPPSTAHATPPHQDNYYFCLQPPNVLTAWLALDRVDEENGCLRYVRGSHHFGLRPHGRTSVVGFSQGITDYGPDDEREEVAIALDPGDLVCHHGELIHRADANRSASRTRRAFAMVFEGESCRRDEVAFQRYLDGAREQHLAAGLKV
jgi:phytanoyl-CoA hydroxylase